MKNLEEKKSSSSEIERKQECLSNETYQISVRESFQFHPTFQDTIIDLFPASKWRREQRHCEGKQIVCGVKNFDFGIDDAVLIEDISYYYDSGCYVEIS